MKFINAYLLFLVVIVGCGKTDNPTNADNVIYGQIWDGVSGNAIGQAGVRLSSPYDLSLALFDTSDGSGYYSFENMDSGKYDITVEATGYLKAVGQVIHEGGESFRNFALTPDTTDTAHARPGRYPLTKSPFEPKFVRVGQIVAY